ncbi:hypothetical protein SprV_0100414400 [Sparganum proliferum]
MGKLTPQSRSTQWIRSPPETQVAQLQPPPLSRLPTDPTTVGAHGTVPSVPRLIDLPQFRLRRRAPHPPPPQGCQPAPDLKPSGSTPLGPSTKPPMRAFRLQLTGRPSSATGEVAKKRVTRCDNKKQRHLNAPSDHQKVDQRADQKVIVTNPRVRRYHSTEILMDINEDRTKGFVVTRVPEKCPLRLGDEIVEINGCQCPDMSLSWLVCHLQSATSIHAQVIDATDENLGRR